MTKGTNSKMRMIKRVASVLVLMLVLVSGGVQYVKAKETIEKYSFNLYLDYTTGDPYAYSGDIWLTGPQNAYVDYATGSYDFVASIVARVYPSNSIVSSFTLANTIVYPGYITYVQSWAYQNGYSRAVLRGESNHDVIYNPQGDWWMQ